MQFTAAGERGWQREGNPAELFSLFFELQQETGNGKSLLFG